MLRPLPGGISEAETGDPRAVTSSPPRLYRPTTGDDYRYLRLLWDGCTPRQARDAVGITADRADFWVSRLRRDAAAVVGRPVNLTAALRLLFAPQDAQSLLRNPECDCCESVPPTGVNAV